jgi:hypothetical protein
MIEYIYLDMDNMSLKKTLKDLKEVYFKGKNTVHERVTCSDSSQPVIISMSNSRHSEASVNLSLSRIKE